MNITTPTTTTTTAATLPNFFPLPAATSFTLFEPTFHRPPPYSKSQGIEMPHADRQATQIANAVRAKIFSFEFAIHRADRGDLV